MKKLLAGIAMSALLVAGCSSSPVPVTSEDAPNDTMKALAELSSESSAEDVSAALQTIVTATAEKYSYQLKFDTTADGTNIDFSGEEPASVPVNAQTIDYRLADDATVYELLEQEYGDEITAGLLRADAKNTVTASCELKDTQFGQNTLDLTLLTSDKQDQSTNYDEDNIDAVVRNTVMIPMFSYMGSELVVKPMVNPEDYDFKLEKSGNTYTLTISMKDEEAYNKILDDYFKNNYGYERTDLKRDGSLIADTYKTTQVEMTVNMDEEGVIQSLKSVNVSSVDIPDQETIEVRLEQNVTISQAPEKMNDALSDFFKKYDEGEYKDGSEFTLSF